LALLADVFLKARTDVAADDDMRAALEACLARMRAEGRTAWPEAEIEAAAYVRHLAARAPSGDPEQLGKLHAADLYLACACAAGDEASIAVFDQRYLAPLPAQLTRRGIAPDLANDAVQWLRERLFVGPEKIREYDGRGALAGWLRVAAVRAASNLRRDDARRAAREAEAGAPAALTAVDPELALIKRRYGEAFRTALRDAFAALSEEERNVLRLHFVDGLNLEGIAQVLGLSRATVGRRMLSGRTRALEETLRLLGERIEASPTELVSILGVVRSKLDLSFGALVPPA